MTDSRSSIDLAPSKSYASALSSVSQNEPALLNNSAPKDDIQVMQLIPPLSKDTVSSIQKLQMAFNNCALAILAQFPDFVKDKITITQSFTKTRAEKTLHSISVISRPLLGPTTVIYEVRASYYWVKQYSQRVNITLTLIDHSIPAR